MSFNAKLSDKSKRIGRKIFEMTVGIQMVKIVNKKILEKPDLTPSSQQSLDSPTIHPSCKDTKETLHSRHIALTQTF